MLEVEALIVGQDLAGRIEVVLDELQSLAHRAKENGSSDLALAAHDVVEDIYVLLDQLALAECTVPFRDVG